MAYRDLDGVIKEMCDADGREETCRRVLVMDAGDNVIEEFPAGDFERAETKYARGIREGRLHLIGIPS